MVCNPTIKFGTVLNYAKKLGATALATGHYARVLKDTANIFHLHCGQDTDKDQSYFLAYMTQQQLSEVVFPLGDMTKPKVRELAHKEGLRPVVNYESQDICFIRDQSYNEFLMDQFNMDEKPGYIEDINGRVIGEHKGLHNYTVGQRRGINCPSSEPYYVVKIDNQRNKLIVGGKRDLLCSDFRVSDINWILKSPDTQITAKTRVRYRSRAYETTIIPIDKKTAHVKFKTPQLAVAPGQAAVFYKGKEVLGGGWIHPYR